MICVNSVNVTPRNLTIKPGEWYYGMHAAVCPLNATCCSVKWASSNPNAATVNPTTGYVYGVRSGTAVITATATDGSGKRDCCTVTVTDKTPISSITVNPQTVSMKAGETRFLTVTVCPTNATKKSVKWSSGNTSVATVNPNSGLVMAQSTGIVTIYATATDGSGVCGCCEVWVKGKTPVFLLHGRTSNSFDTWGATNGIFVNPLNPEEKDNNHFDSNINALSQGNVRALYTSKTVQEIRSYSLGLPIKVDGVVNNNFIVPGIHNGEFKDGNFTTQHPEGGNLAYYLKNQGYKENINLFAFNYPNEDAVIHSAKKLEKYIENLISYVRSSGTNEMKACFYESRGAYDRNDFRINLVGHSMGGLVSRYYIENLGQDAHVDKLITIDTPHWGSGYADASVIPFVHKLCDHDLELTSPMNNPNSNDPNPKVGFCVYCKDDYPITPKLTNPANRTTKYYAIAGIDFVTDKGVNHKNDYVFEMSANYTTFQQIVNFLKSKNIYRYVEEDGKMVKEEIDIFKNGDNMVGFMSQIGWSENMGASPTKRIQMYKIFIDVDTNGGNGNEIIGLEALNMLHGKIQHRPVVMQQVYQYLQE